MKGYYHWPSRHWWHCDGEGWTDEPAQSRGNPRVWCHLLTTPAASFFRQATCHSDMQYHTHQTLMMIDNMIQCILCANAFKFYFKHVKVVKHWEKILTPKCMNEVVNAKKIMFLFNSNIYAFNKNYIAQPLCLYNQMCIH